MFFKGSESIPRWR